MSLISLIVLVCVIALAFYANNNWIPPGMIRTIFNVVLMLVCVIVVLALTGLLNHLDTRI